ncbi:MAG: hypothetical protein NZ840_00565 [Anaerolineales bacterium]|nr:hypothetical protein [Anaerolineales bacterium]MDW8160531.1 hypothetical protein [Anaerolineales bacterium]
MKSLSPSLTKWRFLCLTMLTLLACSTVDLLTQRTATPEPTLGVTETPTATVDFVAQTATAQETQAAQDAQATQVAAQQTQQAEEALRATKVALEPYEIALSGLGVVPSEGQIYLADSSVTLQGSGFQKYFYADQFPGIVGRNIAIQAEIQWNSRFGDAGCGFAFRSNGDLDKPNQYALIAMRAFGGHVAFEVHSEGTVINRIEVYPHSYDPQFDWQNGVTNRVSAVLRENSLQIFTHGILLETMDPTAEPRPPVLPPPPAPPQSNDTSEWAEYRAELEAYNAMKQEVLKKYNFFRSRFREGAGNYPEGLVYLVAYAGSGDITCQFKNAFLWVGSP